MKSTHGKPSTDLFPQLPFLEVPTGVSGHMSPSAGQTIGEEEGEGREDEVDETWLELMAVTRKEGLGVEGEMEVVLLGTMAMTVEEEPTGVEDVISDVAEFCTVMRVTFSIACRGKLALFPAKILAVAGWLDKQLPEALAIPLVRVQSEL